MDIGALKVKNFTSTLSLNKTEPLFYTAEKLPRGQNSRRLGRLSEREKRRGERAD